MPIPLDEITDRLVTEAPLPPLDGPVGDLLSPDALAAGVTREISDVQDYHLTTRWAAAARKAGYGGLRYQARFSTHHAPAIAHFALAGDNPDWPVTDHRTLATVLRDDIGYDLRRSLPASDAAFALVEDDGADVD